MSASTPPWKLSTVPDRSQGAEIEGSGDLKPLLSEILLGILQGDGEDQAMNLKEDSLSIVLFVGVNGVGKTTTIGKLAHQYKEQGRKVVLAAGDTFRAGAIEQLEVWGERVGVDVIRHQAGLRPGGSDL